MEDVWNACIWINEPAVSRKTLTWYPGKKIWRLTLEYLCHMSGCIQSAAVFRSPVNVQSCDGSFEVNEVWKVRTVLVVGIEARAGSHACAILPA